MKQLHKPSMKDFPRTKEGEKEYRRQHAKWYYHTHRQDPEFLKRMADNARRRRRGVKTEFHKSRTTFERKRDKTDFQRGYRIDRFMKLHDSRLIRAISDVMNGAQLGM